MKIELTQIGTVRTDAKEIPKYWSDSDVEGVLIINEEYREGIAGIQPEDRIVVIFCFHKSILFSPEYLKQHPRGDITRQKRGVFSIASPIRPNPIGMSVLEVTGVEENMIHVKGLDILDGTPILDIKPYRF